MEHYSIGLVWSDEDGGYIATVPELENLAAFGESADEALAEALTAIEAYVEAFVADGLLAPKGRKKSRYSGQLRIRLPRNLHRNLASAAEHEGCSLNTFIVSLLSQNYAFHKTAQIQRAALLGVRGSVAAQCKSESATQFFPIRERTVEQFPEAEDLTHSLQASAVQ
ncbi:MAG: type II toxin-antitoxin system HicB family antitoxin [Candidatus Brocadiae bacterium]|nr:type II toxin-antitoxin system HicB family antitoxin [Candidatus Brocadiia bacterium]